MKQLLLLAAACCIITVSKAQITKGSTMIGGSIGYNYSDTKNIDTNTNYNSSTTSNGFNFGVSYGKCFKENTFWGVTASFSYSDSKNITVFNNASNSYQSRNLYIGVFERKYYPIITNFYCFGQAGLGFNYGNSELTINSSKGYDISLNLFPGISYKASKKIYLETSLRNLFNIVYSHNENKYYSTTSTQNSLNTYIQLPTQILQNLNVGMTIILGK